MVADALRRFREHAASIETRSPFDRRSLPIYALIFVAGAVGLILMRLTGFTVDPSIGAGVPTLAILFLIAAWAGRRYGHDRLAGWLEASALAELQGAALMLVLYPVTALSGPFADDRVASLDAALGFDWASFTGAIARHPAVTDVTIAVYQSFNWQPAVIVGLLFYLGRSDRAWRLVLSGTIALLISIAIYSALPSEGAFLHSGHPASEFGRFATFGSWHFGLIVHLIKDSGARVINASLFGGLVSFPSYHAAAALLFAWAMWPTRLRWTFVLLNVGVAVSAIPVGAHYLVDILGGVAVGAGAIVMTAAQTTLRADPKCSLLASE